MTRRASARLPSPTPRLTPPQAMLTTTYVYGVETLDGFDAWALFEACDAGDLGRVEALLAKDPRLVNAQFWYQLPLHRAVREGHAAIVELLLKRGADPGQSRFTYNSWDKLLLCARQRGHRRVESLLQRAMTRRFRYAPEFDALKDAIIARNPRRVAAVLRKRPHLVRASDALGNNPLHWSVLTRQLGMIERFADLGTPIDAPRANGQTPVLLALNGMDYWYRATRGSAHPSLRNTAVMVGSLLAHGAEYTLSVAAAVGDQERVEQLLRADPGLATRLDSARISPLSYAARDEHLHIVRLLLEHGADPNQPQEAAPQGLALYEACCRNHYEMAELLLDHGADPNAGVDSCEVCLTIAARYHGERARSLQELLVRRGAIQPPYAMSLAQLKQAVRNGQEVVRHEEFLDNVLAHNDGKLLDLCLDADPTMIERMQATYPRSPALVRRLLARGLNPNQTDWEGRTILHAAAEHGDVRVAKVLLDAGADIHAREREFHGTPLAAAVRAFRSDDPSSAEHGRAMIELLLQRGAAPNPPDDESWATPLAWATRLGHEELAALLKAHGAV